MNLDLLFADLAARYPLVTRKLEIAARTWEITSVEDQEELIRRVKSEADLADFPFGLMLWPAAAGLTQALLERPELVEGRNVLEIGCGMGVAGLAAAASGAASVTQTDFLTDALTLTRWNGHVNRDRLPRLPTVATGDWRSFPPELLGPYDLVIGSDVLYERSVHDVLQQLLPRLIGPKGQILLSDPMRYKALDFVERLEAQGDWRIDISSVRVSARDTSTAASPFGRHEIALFALERC